MIKFALVGCGRIAKRHSELLGNNQIKGAKLVAVCDKVKEKAKAIEERFHVPSYACMHEMMSNNEVDVVVILSESGLHSRHTIELARYGAHIMVEKPMALTLKDADEMINACRSNNIKLFIIKQNRFNTPVVALRKALENGRFGKLFMGTVRVRWCRTQEYYAQDPWRGTWAKDGGVLTNQASHHLDLLEWMMGEVESVFAYSKKSLAKIEAEDTAAVLLKFKNGGLGIIEATTAIRPKDLEGSLSILGEKGSVEVGGFAVNEMRTWNFSDYESGDEKVIDEYSVNPPNVYGFGHQSYYEHVVDCIKNNNTQLVDGYEGKKSLKLIIAIYESIESGKEVFLNSLPNLSKLGKNE